MIVRKLLLITLLLAAPLVHGTDLKVVATIKPVHSLVAALMRGVGEPALLIDSNNSLHHTSLKPSQRSQLAQADRVFWVGPGLETFMPAIIDSFDDSRRAVALDGSQGIERLPLRANRGHHHQATASDSHIWLSPGNALVMAAEIARRLSTADPEHAPVYRRNLDALNRKITALHARLAEQLRHSTKPFIGYHDSLQYFEHTFDLNSVAFVTGSSHTPVSARHLQRLLEQMQKQSIQCVFYDTPSQPKVIDVLLAASGARALGIDTTGFNISPGPELWFEMMQALADTMASCLNNV